MGTSNSYGGASGNNPLIPSWLDNTEPPENAAPANGETPAIQVQPQQPNAIPVSAPDRFKAARRNFTQFVSSGGQDKASLGRALSGYVSKVSGGSQNAMIRMGPSRETSVKLANFISIAAQHGAENALASLNLSHLVSQPLTDVLLGVMEVICPDGGTIDEGIARDAFADTIDDLNEHGDISFDEINEAQLMVVFEAYMCRAIEAKICNDIGLKSVSKAQNIFDISYVQEQLHEFIQISVSRAISQFNIPLNEMSTNKINEHVNSIYVMAFDFIELLGNEVSD